ncbi:MAG: CotH kinase family protein [Verrucomicrobia bacterium]|nr:CotH kinase family protein [Verrucomicrobiota bacterium]
MREDRKILAQFDRDGNKRLDATERAAARDFLQQERAGNPRGFGGRGPGGPPGRGGRTSTPPETGEKIVAAEVATFTNEPLYGPGVLRTLFLEFDDSDWERELEDFHGTDVDVPATLRVDGRTYRDVGVRFRGMSSYMMVPTGYKRSLNLSIDYAHEDQALLGFRTLNLLNSHEDPSFLRAALFSHIARQYLPAPRVNFVRTVINGENWGVYASAEQFNKDFLKANFGSIKGARWKVPGSPGGRGGMAYLGEDAAAYRRTYEIKSKDEPASWAKLIRVCRLLEETAPDQLAAALAPHFDVDGALRFLALDVALVNGDGYWTRTSDYSIGEDVGGRLHLVPHDMNEAFSNGGGPGGRGGPRGGRGPRPPEGAVGFGPAGREGGGAGGPGPGTPPAGRGGFGGVRGGGPNLDPLAPLNNPNAALAAKLLAVPALRARYLGYVRDIAEKWLDWKVLGPVAQAYHDLIDADVKRDTRKLDRYEEFASSLGDDPRSLKTFAEQRRTFLLQHPEIAAAR